MLKSVLISLFKTFLFILFLLGCGALAYHYYEEQHKPVDVKTIHVRNGPISSYVRVTGKVVNDRMVKLSALINGEIKKLAVNVGDHVKAGQLLVSFDNTNNIHLIQRAKAEANAQHYALKAAQQTLKRLQKLTHSGAITREKLDQAQTEVNLAQARLQVAREDLFIEKNRLKHTRLLAPYSGVITEKFAGTGQWTESGTPLLVLASDQGREIEAQIDAGDFSSIKVGKSLDVSADAYPGLHWRETIRRISPAVSSDKENSSNTFPVRISLGKKAPTLLLNQQVDIKLSIASKKKAITVPLSALIENNDKYQLMLLEDGKVRRVTIESGIESYTHVEIIKVLDKSITLNQHSRIILPDTPVIQALKDGRAAISHNEQQVNPKTSRKLAHEHHTAT